MAAQQRIHPVDVETPPAAPIVPRSGSQNKKDVPAEHAPVPPIQHTVPLIPSKPPKKRSCCCCRFICWTVSLLPVLLILVAATAGVLYLVFQPKIPNYSINQLRISEFTLNSDFSLSTHFTVAVTARNPNKKIGIYYESGSNINVFYSDIKLAGGSLPNFYQGHQNTTVLNVSLVGKYENANGLLTALSELQRQTGSIPLDLIANVPVRVKLGKLKLMKLKFRVKCDLVVDSLTANSPVRITASSCQFRFKI